MEERALPGIAVLAMSRSIPEGDEDEGGADDGDVMMTGRIS